MKMVVIFGDTVKGREIFFERVSFIEKEYEVIHEDEVKTKKNRLVYLHFKKKRGNKMSIERGYKVGKTYRAEDKSVQEYVEKIKERYEDEINSEGSKFYKHLMFYKDGQHKEINLESEDDRGFNRELEINKKNIEGYYVEEYIVIEGVVSKLGVKLKYSAEI